MKKLLNLMLLAGCIFWLSACGEDDPLIAPVDGDAQVITENIARDITWTKDKVWILGSRITVLSGATLTIEPGTIIKGQAGTGSNATALLIARGGKINAEGTASEPIIFTSVADEIEPGQIASPNLDPTLNGLWGGVLILGNAPISADAAAVQIEGIPPSDQNGLYGGGNPEDNSGIFKYVSIRHGGANIGEGNEINGLTLGGVGSATIIENIEIVANQDDGVEWFGGTVSVKNVIVWNTGDDAIDTDQSWSGTLDNFVIIAPGDEAFELDGPEGALLANNDHTIKNGTVRASAFLGDDNERAAQGLVDLDPESHTILQNIYFFDLAEGQDIDQNICAEGNCPFTNIELKVPDGTSANDFVAGDGLPAGFSEVNEGTVGASLSAFNSWSWTATSGALDF